MTPLTTACVLALLAPVAVPAFTLGGVIAGVVAARCLLGAALVEAGRVVAGERRGR